MHDFDRIQADYESLIPILDGNHHGFSGGYDSSGGWDGVPVHHHRNFALSENEEMELAAELLDVRNEQELDQFFDDVGHFVHKVGSGIVSGVETAGRGIATAGRAVGRGAETAARAVGRGAETVYNDVRPYVVPVLKGIAKTCAAGRRNSGRWTGWRRDRRGDQHRGIRRQGQRRRKVQGDKRRGPRVRVSAPVRAIRPFGDGAWRTAPRGVSPRHAARAAIIAAARRYAPGLLHRAHGHTAPGYYGGSPTLDIDNLDGAFDDSDTADERGSRGHRCQCIRRCRHRRTAQCPPARKLDSARPADHPPGCLIDDRLHRRDLGSVYFVAIDPVRRSTDGHRVTTKRFASRSRTSLPKGPRSSRPVWPQFARKALDCVRVRST